MRDAEAEAEADAEADAAAADEAMTAASLVVVGSFLLADATSCSIYMRRPVSGGGVVAVVG